MVDFTNLNDIYHLSMIIIGFSGLILSAAMLGRLFYQDRQKRLKEEAREKAKRKINRRK